MRKARTHKKRGMLRMRSTRKVKRMRSTRHAKRAKRVNRSRGGAISDVVVAGTNGVMSEKEHEQMMLNQDQQGLE
jgi:hypothetical protein